MLLGIDYGTTCTVVAAADRGNYPVVSFHTACGFASWAVSPTGAVGYPCPWAL